MRSRGAAAVVLAGLVLAACGHHDPGPRAARIHWAGTRLPAPAGTRAMVRAATYCSGRWVVVGATADAQGATRPAAWTTTDGRSWRAVTLRPGGDYYAAREILTSVGCSRGRVAALGAKSGGAHGMPRTATWDQRPDGSLVAVRAGYELYGGGNAVAVSRLQGSPRGYLIAGTRVSGAAVWTSGTRRSFRLHEGAPGLASTPRLRSQALDATSYHGGWLVVGASTDRAGHVAGRVWTATGGGRWRGTALPGGDTISTAERAVTTADGPVVAGLDDQGFGVWVRQAGSWTLASAFGVRDPAGTEAAYVTSLADDGAHLLAAYSDGARFRLSLGSVSGAWGDVALPQDVTVAGDHTLAVAGHPGRLVLLLTDDGRAGRVWLGRVSEPAH